MKRLPYIRKAVQISVILLFCLLPWLNRHGFNEIKGSLFAFDFFGLPFADPASSVQAALSSAYLGFNPAWTIMIGAFFSLLLAFLLGRVFCGWICPYGFLSEMVHCLVRKRGGLGAGKRNQGKVFAAKTIFMLLLLLCAMLLGYPLLGLLSFPGELSLIPMQIFSHAGAMAVLTVLLIPFAVILLELLLGKRLWCSYLCPQSVMLGASAWLLPRKAPGLRLAWQAQKCTCGKESPCAKACSLKLNPRKKGGPKRRDCIMCGDCVSACADYGKALGFSTRNSCG